MNIETIEKYLNAFKNHEPVGDGKTVVSGIKFSSTSFNYSSGRWDDTEYKVDVTLDKTAGVLIFFDRDHSTDEKSKTVVMDTASIDGIELRGKDPKEVYDVKVEIV